MPSATGPVKVRADDAHGYPPLPVGRIPVTVGRHAGKTLSQCPPDFLMWLATSSKCPTYRRAAAELLGLGAETEAGLGTDPEPGAASVVLPGVVFRWGEGMRAEFRDDPAALAVVARGLSRLQELCSAVTNRPWPADGEGR